MDSVARVFFAGLIGILLGLLVIWIVAGRAPAADDHLQQYHADPLRDAWFRSLMRPDIGTSCCNLNDCRETEAEWRDGEWWALVDGDWRRIPQNKIVTSPLSIDGAAYVCVTTIGSILCFVPPIPGS